MIIKPYNNSHAFYILLLLTGVSCKPTYRYYAPTVNPALLQNKGEVHASGEISTSGTILKGAAAVTNSLGVMGLYSSSFYKNYRCKEGEIGLGYYRSDNAPRSLFVAGGTGFGSNYEYTDSTHKTRSYQGNFYRPFIQFNTGVSNGKIAGRLTGDAIFCIKASVLLYDGKHLTGPNDPIRTNAFLLEPAFKWGLGSRVVHFDMIVGFPIHPTVVGLSNYSDAKTFPVNLSFGLRFLINRHKPE